MSIPPVLGFHPSAMDLSSVARETAKQYRDARRAVANGNAIVGSIAVAPTIDVPRVAISPGDREALASARAWGNRVRLAEAEWRGYGRRTASRAAALAQLEVAQASLAYAQATYAVDLDRITANVVPPAVVQAFLDERRRAEEWGRAVGAAPRRSTRR
jgi:hypothetical protein